MFSPFSCANLSQVDDDEPVTTSPYSTPKKSRSRRSAVLIQRSKDNKNPYASVGLDKFAAVMAELEEKRRQIYAQTGSHDNTLVHFVYKKPDDAVPVPIVVKLKDNAINISGSSSPDRDEKHAVLAAGKCKKMDEEVKNPVSESDKLTKKKVLPAECMRCSEMWMRPCYYLPVAVILILVLLAVFGRSTAILCTSIGWYAVPTLKEYQGSKYSTRSRAPKKEYARRLSDNKIVADLGLLSSPKK